MGPRAGLDGRNISSSLGFDHEPSSPYSVSIPNELPGPHITNIQYIIYNLYNIYTIYIILQGYSKCLSRCNCPAAIPHQIREKTAI